MVVQYQNMEAKQLQKSYFDVLGLCCSSEVPLIETILKSLDGVEEYSVIVTTKTVVVVHDTLLITQHEIVKALNQARLEANLRMSDDATYQKQWPSPFAVASGLFLLLSFLKFVYPPFIWLSLGAVAVGVIPIFLRGLASITNFRLDTNILVIIAVIGSIAMDDYIEAGTIVFLFTIAEWLETRASYKANAVMSSLISLAPQKAVIEETGEEVNTNEVKINTVLAVKAGQVIPIDGVVVDGKCEIDEKTLTGESFPVPKQKDSTVWAGTINLNGYISVRTTALAEECVVAKMTKLVEEAQTNKSKTQYLIDTCAQYYTPAVIVISAAVAVAPLVLKVHDRSHWFHLALVILVSSCPCALILSTPVATFCALTKAATAGLLIKGGNYLETLAKVKVMAFDKTGTITRGEFLVTDFQTLSGEISLEKLLYWVSSIESKSSHPMSAALVDHARSLDIEPKPDNVEEFQNFPGEGIHGKIDGLDIYIGNRKIGHRSGSKTVPPVEVDKKSGKTIGYIYCGAAPSGVFSLSDACRTGAAEAIKELKLLGIKTAMLTGDSRSAAMHAQEQLSYALEAVHAELLPEDKATIIEELKKQGPTAMIGDGLNDAPALATADIGISMGISGSALATETGNVILMSNDIGKVPKAIQLARKAHRKVIENVVLSISTKTAIIALAFAGHPLVWAAVLADVGTCLLVIFNSMMLLQGSQEHEGNCCKSQHAHRHGGKKSGHNHGNCCATGHIHKHGHEISSGNHGHCCSTSHGSKNSFHHNHSDCCSTSHVHKHVNESPTHSHENCCSTSHGHAHRNEHFVHNHGYCCSPKKVHRHCNENSAHNHGSFCSTETSEKVRLLEKSHGCASRCQSSHSHTHSCGSKTCKGSTQMQEECLSIRDDHEHETKNRGHGYYKKTNNHPEVNSPKNYGDGSENLVGEQMKTIGEHLHGKKQCHHEIEKVDDQDLEPLLGLEEGKYAPEGEHCHSSSCDKSHAITIVTSNSHGNIGHSNCKRCHHQTVPEPHPNVTKCCKGRDNPNEQFGADGYHTVTM
ncbi:hypothetical protein K2173_003544 [Erythroxylum novogranatense]|uniref:HMA domain-containing protein n=1 Tax=Erythroxylum novogranatense TaxID=1862640 RepID=A0AAV8TAC7_9ROSI|nr:hypothetical protein K2173_003544 [Erythroxylum novogranatense]